jgi:hypothetical protein
MLRLFYFLILSCYAHGSRISTRLGCEDPGGRRKAFVLSARGLHRVGRCGRGDPADGRAYNAVKVLNKEF